MRWNLACALMTLLIAGATPAEELIKPAAPPKPQPEKKDEKPLPGLTHYMGREIAQTMHFAGAPWLTRDSRDREEEPAKLMKALNLKPGMVVCDLGCGNGFYTLKLAEAVGPTGKVLAEEIQPEMLDLLKKRAEKAGVKNIEPVLGTTTDPKLPAGKLDLVLLVDVYHEMDRPEEMLAAIRKSLAPKGRLVLVEFRAEDPNVPIKELHKMSKAQIKKELTANKFKPVEEFDGLPWQHVMFFEAAD
ncbi:MAG TPA: class I SAM-dependent methyltransferase [Tepidisphaeraceae bacterium]|nr:class I SAM-dependent methyltransferase [Tepidisphaeraceae bacterium]